VTGVRLFVPDASGQLKAISKVVPMGDGGYAVLAPYHSAREGWLANDGNLPKVRRRPS
jgi:hypothetical protein